MCCMPRKPRIEYPGACYHVMCRGNRREEIFRDDTDRRLFLHALSQICERTGWIVHSYVLMTNHYHLLIETPEANLSVGMRWFQGTYAQRYCKRHNLVGHVFQGRYKAPLIDPDEPEYFRMASDYIHLNPARAGFLKSERSVLSDYAWSSYPLFLQSRSKRPAWLEFARVASSVGLKGEEASSRRRYRIYLEGWAQECREKGRGSRSKEWEQVRRGWYLGGDFFRDKLLDLIDETLEGKKKTSFGGRIISEHNQKHAKELMEEIWKTLGLSGAELRGLRKTDIRKQGVAWLLKTRTSMTNKWIDGQLNMGSRTNIYKAVAAMEPPGTAEAKKVKKCLVNI